MDQLLRRRLEPEPLRLGRAPAQERTRLLTNMKMGNIYLTTRCNGQHRHVPLLDGRARAAQAYPDQLCYALLKTYIMEKQTAMLDHVNAVDRQNSTEMEARGSLGSRMGNDVFERSGGADVKC